MGRKTFNVQDFKEKCNKQLARTDEDATSEFKSGICTILERVLLDTNNYNGFNYVYWLKIGFSEWQRDGCTEERPAKNQYLYGPTGDIYARIYY